LLKAEPDAVWSRYQFDEKVPSIGDAGAEPPVPSVGNAGIKPPSIATKPPEFTANDFSTLSYNIKGERQLYQFISPPFTANDEEFRLSEDEAKKIDIEALKRNRFRIVTYYDERLGRLVIATDLAALQAIDNQTAASDVPFAERGRPNSKLRVRLNPRWLIAQIRAYPNAVGKDEELLKFLAQMEKYTVLDLRIEAVPALSALFARVMFSND
jgi:hypothetical protein